MYQSDFNYSAAAAAAAAAQLDSLHLWLSAIYRPRWVKVPQRLLWLLEYVTIMNLMNFPLFWFCPLQHLGLLSLI